MTHSFPTAVFPLDVSIDIQHPYAEWWDGLCFLNPKSLGKVAIKHVCKMVEMLNSVA